MKKRPLRSSVPPLPDDTLASTLSRSQIYQDYESAFTGGTGLPLSLHTPEMLQVIRYAEAQGNPFCLLLGQGGSSCAACYALQQKLEKEAQTAPKTLKCFAGLCETTIPLRVGDEVIAFLQTGQILLQAPDRREFNRLARTLLKWGSQVDLKKLEDAYFNIRVISPEKYAALIRLLVIFAEHLAQSANQMRLRSKPDEAPNMTEARVYIDAHSSEEFSLPDVARVVNMSAHYFGEKFLAATGLHFLDYVARTRIEKARLLLLDPRLRISEAAFAVGFQSLSQFNRDFKKITGLSPSEYRASIALLH